MNTHGSNALADWITTAPSLRNVPVPPPPGSDSPSPAVDSVNRQIGAVREPVGTTPSESTALDQLMKRADDYYARGQVEVARDFISSACGLANDNPDLLATLGSLEYQLGHYDAARQAFERAAQLRPEEGSLQTKLAAACLKCGNQEGWETSIIRAIDLNRRDVDAWGLLARFLLQKEMYLQSARAFHHLLEVTPDDVPALLGLGKCFYKLGDLASSRMVFERVLTVDPRNELATENLTLLKQTDTAPKTEGAVARAPQPIESDKSEVLMSVAQPSADASQLSGGSRNDELPPEVAPIVQQAEAEYNRGNLAAACRCLQGALNLAPTSESILDALGSLRFQLGEYPAAQQAFGRAIQLNPDQAALHTKLAAVYQRLNDADAFELSISQALALAPNDADAYKLLANQRYQQERYIDAARSCVKVLEQRRQDVDTLLLLGNCLYKAGNTEMAQKTYEEVLKVDPQNAIASENLRVLKTSPSPA